VQFVSHTIVPPPLVMDTTTIGSAACTGATITPSAISNVVAPYAAPRIASARLSPEVLSRLFIGSPLLLHSGESSPCDVHLYPAAFQVDNQEDPLLGRNLALATARLVRVDGGVVRDRHA